MKNILAFKNLQCHLQLIATCWVCILAGLTSQLKASHIVGGEINYTFLRYNQDESFITYKVDLILYRDPTGIAYDNFANFGIYRQNSVGTWDSYDIKDAPRSPITEITRNSDPCKTRLLNSERLQSATYSFEVSLEVGDFDYLISYQRCCRNYTINNIMSNGDIGAVYDVLITSAAQKNGNSSPVFAELPPIFICSGFDLKVDNSAVDPEGDELVYSFCNSIFPGYDDGSGNGCCGCVAPDPERCRPPYLNVVYIPPFSPENPMAGDPQITVNSQTGLITGKPEFNGSYVVAVCVEEYRNGVLLSKTRRDFEFNVVDCEENLDAQLLSNKLILDSNLSQDSVYYYESCHQLEIDITNASTKAAYIDDYTWEIFDENNNLAFTRKGPYERSIKIDLPDYGYYRGYMIINDGEECLDTARFVINIIPEIELNLSATYDTCVSSPVQFEASNAFQNPDIIWEWDMGDGTILNEPPQEYAFSNPGSYLIQIQALDTFGCTTKANQVIDYFPFQLTEPDTILLDTLVCALDSILIDSEWVFSSGSYLESIPSEFNGCDSLIKKIAVSFLETNSPDISPVSICDGDSLLYNQNWIKNAGNYFDTLVSHLGCDSIIGIDLKINAIEYSEDNIQLCPSDSTFFNEVFIKNGGSYFDTLTSMANCDSIIRLNVIEIADQLTILNGEFCEGSSYSYNNQELNRADSYIFEYETYQGCDSIVELTLIENQNKQRVLPIEICEGGYYEIGEEKLDEEGSYSIEFQTSSGCDSIIIVELEVLSESEKELIDTICLGETYAFGAINLNLPGLYYDTLQNTNGCDSLIVLDLVVGENLTRIDAEQNMQLSYGDSILLRPEIIGGDLIEKNWYRVESYLSNDLKLNYLVEKDDWIYFNSTNELFCIALDSIYIRAIIEKDIYLPNVISPNGDGINDYFNLGASSSVSESQLSIYDRWGNQLFAGPFTTEKQIQNGWDGKHQGKEVEIGTYAYRLEVIYIDGEQKIFFGDLQVIR